MIPKNCKRLAEVDFPIAEVSRHAVRKAGRGHPWNLHKWWARRPLASSRAMLLALLLPDPGDPHCPDAFRTEARRILGRYPLPTDWEEPTDPEEGLRRILLRFIADFADREVAASPPYLEMSRALVRAAHGEEAPLVVDPFAGGGSIPLEALRVGCETFASDLNPVACLILKVLLEEIPRHGPPLAEDLQKIGGEIKDMAARELADLYPVDPDGATPTAYLWARTVTCEAPTCGAEIPLIRSFWLCNETERKRALRHHVERRARSRPHVEFEVFEPKSDAEVHAATVTNARATCLCCGVVLPPDRVRTQLTAQRGGTDPVFNDGGLRVGGARMTAVVTVRPGDTRRNYRLATEADYGAVRKAQEHVAQVLEAWKRGGGQRLCPVPDEPIALTEMRRVSAPIYGMRRWGDLFTARQKVTLMVLAAKIGNAQASTAVRALMGCALSVFARSCNGNARLRPDSSVAPIFGRNALRDCQKFRVWAVLGGPDGSAGMSAL